MLNFIMENVIWPTLRRAGTAAGLSFSFTATEMDTLEAAGVILIGWLLDLRNSRYNREMVKAKSRAVQ
jgi:hypothetical protein